MLAVQRPSMGSSKPPNLEMPFGYSFDTSTSNFPFPSPTAPAPGPSLLDDNESKLLDNFFDGVSSDHFDYSLFTNAPDGTDSGFGWDELPPTFMGTTTSYGQQAHIGGNDLIFDGLSTSQQIQLGPSMQNSASADVLAAATLLQNGSNGRSHSMTDGALFHGQDMSLQRSNGQVRPQSISHFPPSRSYTGNHERTSSNEYLRDTFYTDMVFGTPSETAAQHRRMNPKMDIRWGSDQSFGTPQGFIAPNHPNTVAEVERAQIQGLDAAFELNHGENTSAGNSRPPSPPSAFKTHNKAKSISKNNDDADADSRPRKKRKSKYQDDVDEDDDIPAPGSAGPKKRKSVKKEQHEMSPVDSEPNHKRRKSTAASNSGAKPTRENLTEDQKRENHIKSEQKRRTLIREGFEDLGELVPGLRGGGFSKSAVLIMAADWLEDLIQGNEVLRGQLAQLEGR